MLLKYKHNDICEYINVYLQLPEQTLTSSFSAPPRSPQALNQPSKIVWVCLSPFFPLTWFYWRDMNLWNPAGFLVAPQKNVTTGMFTMTFTSFLSAAVSSLTRASLWNRANDRIIMIMDGVYWAHKDTVWSSAVHRFITFFVTRMEQKFQRHTNHY